MMNVITGTRNSITYSIKLYMYENFIFLKSDIFFIEKGDRLNEKKI